MYILKLYNTLFDLLFPEHCLGCGKFGTPLCTKCTHAIPRSGPTEFPYAHAVFSYKHPYINKLIWEMKYSGNKRIAKVFARYLAELLAQDILDAAYFKSSYILIPVPLSKKKQRIRGYNQAAWIAEETLRYLDPSIRKKIVYKPEFIERHHKEKSQARTKHRDERLSQIEGAFYVPEKMKSLMKNKNIILIDDVTTSGSTLIEIEQLLQKVGTKQVTAYTIAH
jgi:competence protein ComFC